MSEGRLCAVETLRYIPGMENLRVFVLQQMIPEEFFLIKEFFRYKAVLVYREWLFYLS